MELLTEEIPPIPGKPQEQLEESHENESIVYPTGLKLWVSVAATMLSTMLVGLDMTIVAVSVPAITDSFHTVANIGWYSAAYSVMFSSFAFFFAHLYGAAWIQLCYCLDVVYSCWFSDF
ncbi:hypothetical protein ASPZODRAFT_137357 [Penicilliopsis zonata CBS 506.65]|uniref:Major facilitator superfamily (MFS) profile domain-containing protein n=1 Tax=Penicilliopsis zonata CBS 506.65 TaxID=1073090 RepID=A0A1L9S5A2_9EURO|nr:hypothetical protein ASPZODRAFT_137357 [Penicilliopsis zonata CBS 506.65]OJJ42348.1 hypothetical protein ASPZODRAFT_137357 [Penicilliopsis zonata CBS 506.65]